MNRSLCCGFINEHKYGGLLA